MNERAQARWHFNDKNKIGKYRNHQRALEDGSIPFLELKKWWEHQKNGGTKGYLRPRSLGNLFRGRLIKSGKKSGKIDERSAISS
jgi:hypothetical protein